MSASYYTFTGRTFPARDIIRDLGAEWRPAHRAWVGQLGGNGLASKFALLRRMGVTITRTETDPHA